MKHFKSITTSFSDPDNFEDATNVYETDDNDEDDTSVCNGECKVSVAYTADCGTVRCAHCGRKL